MCCQNLGKDLSRVCSQEMNLWKGVYRPLFLVFWASYSFFGTGLVSIFLYRLFELGTGQRKEEKKEKNKISNKTH